MPQLPETLIWDDEKKDDKGPKTLVWDTEPRHYKEPKKLEGADWWISQGFRTIPPVAGSIIGGMVGNVPGGMAGGAGGGLIGDVLAQKYEQARGYRDSFNPWEAGINTVLSAAPPIFEAGELAGPGLRALGAHVGRHALSGAAEGAIIGAGGAPFQEWARSGKAPSVGEALSQSYGAMGPGALMGGVTGGVVSGVMGARGPRRPIELSPEVIPPSIPSPNSPTPPSGPTIGPSAGRHPSVPRDWLPFEEPLPEGRPPSEPLPTNEPGLEGFGPDTEPQQQGLPFGAYQGPSGKFTKSGPGRATRERPFLSEPFQNRFDFEFPDEPQSVDLGPTPTMKDLAPPAAQKEVPVVKAADQPEVQTPAPNKPEVLEAGVTRVGNEYRVAKKNWNKVDVDYWMKKGYMPTGGKDENGMAYMVKSAEAAAPEDIVPPDEDDGGDSSIIDRLKGERGAVSTHGWLPEWIEKRLEGILQRKPSPEEVQAAVQNLSPDMAPEIIHPDIEEASNMDADTANGFIDDTRKAVDYWKSIQEAFESSGDRDGVRIAINKGSEATSVLRTLLERAGHINPTVPPSQAQTDAFSLKLAEQADRNKRVDPLWRLIIQHDSPNRFEQAEDLITSTTDPKTALEHINALEEWMQEAHTDGDPDEHDFLTQLYDLANDHMVALEGQGAEAGGLIPPETQARINQADDPEINPLTGERVGPGYTPDNVTHTPEGTTETYDQAPPKYTGSEEAIYQRAPHLRGMSPIELWDTWKTPDPTTAYAVGDLFDLHPEWMDDVRTQLAARNRPPPPPDIAHDEDLPPGGIDVSRLRQQNVFGGGGGGGGGEPPRGGIPGGEMQGPRNVIPGVDHPPFPMSGQQDLPEMGPHSELIPRETYEDMNVGRSEYPPPSDDNLWQPNLPEVGDSIIRNFHANEDVVTPEMHDLSDYGPDLLTGGESKPGEAEDIHIGSKAEVIAKRNKEIIDTLQKGLPDAKSASWKDTRFILPDGTRKTHEFDIHAEAAENLGIELEDAQHAGVIRVQVGGDGAEIYAPITHQQAAVLSDAPHYTGRTMYVEIPPQDGGRHGGTWISKVFDENSKASQIYNWVNNQFKRFLTDESGELRLPSFGGGGEKPPIESPSGGDGEVPPTEPLPTGPTKPRKKISTLRQWYNLPRGLTTPMDLSAPMRQGLGMILRKEWWTSWKPMVEALGSEGAYQKIVNDIKSRPLATRHTDPSTGKPTKSFYEKAGLAITDVTSTSLRREEATPSSWAETGQFLNKIPGAKDVYAKSMGRGVRATDRAYTAYLNQLRADSFESLLSDAFKDFQAGIKGSRNPYTDLPFAQEIASYVNTATGRGPLKVGRPTIEGGRLGLKESNFEQHAQLLSDILFSPKLFASRVRMLNPATYMMASPFVRKQYLRSLIGVAGAWGTFAVLGQMAGADVSSDPTSADYGKLKFGNTRIDPAGGFQQYLVAAAKLISGHSTSSNTGRDFEQGQGYRPDTEWDIIERFGSNKLHPVAKFGYDLLNASEHQPFHVADRTAQMFIPLIVGDVVELMKDDPALLPLIAPIATGMGSQTYDKGQSESKYIPSDYDLNIQGGPANLWK